MLKLFVIILSYMILIPNAVGMSCLKRELNATESADYVAFQKYSPFSYMLGAAIVGGIAGFITMADHKDSRGEQDLPGWVKQVGVVTLSASMMLSLMESGCRPILSDDANLYKAKMNTVVLKKLRNKRRSFYGIYTFSVLPLLLATHYSSRGDRALILAGGVLLPFITDFVVRHTFARNKVSPWTLKPVVMVHSEETVAMLNFKLRW